MKKNQAGSRTAAAAAEESGVIKVISLHSASAKSASAEYQSYKEHVPYWSLMKERGSVEHRTQSTVIGMHRPGLMPDIRWKRLHAQQSNFVCRALSRARGPWTRSNLPGSRDDTSPAVWTEVPGDGACRCWGPSGGYEKGQAQQRRRPVKPSARGESAWTAGAIDPSAITPQQFGASGNTQPKVLAFQGQHKTFPSAAE
ncbi:unnamed protein product [Boreogadus saida]